MIIDVANLSGLFAGFNLAFDQGFEGAPSVYQTLAMDVNSSTTEQHYPFMDSAPPLREWLGDRVMANLKLRGFSVRNRRFESSISVGREKIEDDQYGVFLPMFQMMGLNAKQHPDKVVFSMLSRGQTDTCYDGQPFFCQTHPISSSGSRVIATASNFLPGATPATTGPAWYLVDASKPVKPMVFQRRTPYEFQALVNTNDVNVFLRDEYAFGVRARVAAGFALWQLPFAPPCRSRSTPMPKPAPA